MTIEEQAKITILELTSENAYGSWELLGATNQDIAKQTGDIPNFDNSKRCVLQVIENLVKTGKVRTLRYNSKNNSYKEVELSRKRLVYELDYADKPDQNTYYWFEATDEGKKEDLKLRSSI